jgi:hypothetical protein
MVSLYSIRGVRQLQVCGCTLGSGGGVSACTTVCTACTHAQHCVVMHR